MAQCLIDVEPFLFSIVLYLSKNHEIMWVQSIELTNVRGFKTTGEIKFSRGINILIGPNNAGKSTIITSLVCLQQDNNQSIPHGTSQPLLTLEPTLGSKSGKILIKLQGINDYINLLSSHRNNPSLNMGDYSKHIQEMNGRLQINITAPIPVQGLQLLYPKPGSNAIQIAKFPNSEPFNILYPFLSKRKISTLVSNVNDQYIKQVSGNFDFLIPKIDALFSSHHPANKIYMETCWDIFNFHVTTDYEGNGKKAGLFIDSYNMIPITAMGEGVMNLLALIVNFCIAENKIFLIEEPENDIHPKALKALLKLIEWKSVNNQFIISTHSNIVAKYLGAVSNAKLFQVSMNIDASTKIPESKIREIGNDKYDRHRVLEDLGYDFFDSGLWDGWLFLEESSSERIINDLLIPVFAKGLLNKIRTFSAGGISSIEPKFLDFNKLFVFLHLEPTYKNKVWVLIDGGEKEGDIIVKMKETYVKADGWNEDHFLQFSKHDFEEYYPDIFHEEVKQVLSIQDKKQKKDEKKQLLEKVLAWIRDNPDDAKKDFEKSAKEVIEILKKIEAKLIKN